ncbi:ABC transporter ATP-binding protein [Furfurilactobacillus curtus]|uniref:ABC transporter ATP-binding protein n=1 Tax=Furfurilactobacillus curtus TaxID=1746200 RepID=A0ABQ5JPQ6_9LACO
MTQSQKTHSTHSLNKRSTHLRALIAQTRPSYWRLSLGLFISLLSTSASLVLPLIAQRLIDRLAHQTFSLSALGPLALLFLLSGVLSMMGMYLFGYVGNQIVANLRKTLWAKYVHLPLSYFTDHSSGESVSRLINDTTLIKDVATSYLPQFISAVVMVTGSFVILLWMDWHLTLVILLAIPVTFLVMWPLGRLMGHISKLTQDGLANLNGYAEEVLSNMRLVKSANAEAYEKNRGNQRIDGLFNLGMRETRLFSIINPIMSIVMMVIIIGVISYGGALVRQNVMTSGTFVAFLLYLFQVVPQITTVASFGNQMQRVNGATTRVYDLLQLASEQLGDRHATVALNKIPLTFRDVSFGYDKRPVLHNLNFTFQPGRVYALVGPSGGGKTTILSIIERYYYPNIRQADKLGRFMAGDQNVASLSLSQWRQQIGYVAQENSLITGTIADNVRYGLSNATDEAIWSALAAADAANFVRQTEHGLATQVGESGLKLSGGQRQRIAIARAFLRNPKLLILDEATASLDSNTEAHIQVALTRLMHDRTTLISAHRLATVQQADEILFIQQGRITGRGTHAQLYRTHELYREFVDHQIIK